MTLLETLATMTPEALAIYKAIQLGESIEKIGTGWSGFTEEVNAGMWWFPVEPVEFALTNTQTLVWVYANGDVCIIWETKNGDEEYIFTPTKPFVSFPFEEAE